MKDSLLNRGSGYAAIALALTALATIAIGLLQHLSGAPRAELCQPDEGTLAHIFQLAIVACAPAIAVFVATADWTMPTKAVRTPAIVVVALVLAFGALYYGEHHLCRGANEGAALANPQSLIPNPGSSTPPDAL